MARHARIETRIPTRIDLAGGTLDLWPIHHVLARKATVNVGVTLPAEIELEVTSGREIALTSEDLAVEARGDFATIATGRQLPLLSLLVGALWRPEWPGLTMRTRAKSPAGAGLGGSSCLGIGVAAALLKAREVLHGTPMPSEDELVRTVQDVEARVIHAPTGCQDYWGGLRGGVNVLRFPPGRVDVTTHAPTALPGLERELVLCYSGVSRASAINNWEIFKRVFDGDKALIATFEEIGAAAARCGEAVTAGDFGAALAASEHEWHLRTRLWPAIETAETQKIDQAARGAGARFSRVCGAGGGGVMAIFAPTERRAAVQAACAAAGGRVLDAGVAASGLAVKVG
jgi:D-glycero-alpha-D-manno-heptose-7-phosphate kinase